MAFTLLPDDGAAPAQTPTPAGKFTLLPDAQQADMPWWEAAARTAAQKFKEMKIGAEQAAVEMLPAFARITLPGALGPIAGAVAQQKTAPAVAGLRSQQDWDQSVMSKDAQQTAAEQSIPGKISRFITGAAPWTAAALAAPELTAQPFGSAALGWLQGLLEPQGTGGNRALSAAAGAGLGYGAQKVGNAIGGAIVGAKPAASDTARQQFVDWAQSNGVPLSRYQMGGDPFVGLLERVSQKLPGSSSFFEGLDAAQRKAITDKIQQLTMGGESGPLMQKAGAVLGDKLPIDAGLVQDVQAIPGNFSNRVGGLAPTEALDTARQYVGGTQIPNPALEQFAPAAKAQAIAQGVPEFVGGSPGILKAGDTVPWSGSNGYLGIRSDIGKKAYGASGADADAWHGLQDSFDNGAYRALQAAGVDPMDLVRLRGAYSVQRLLDRAKTQLPDGTVLYDPSKVSQLIKTKAGQGGSYLDNLPGDTGDELRNLQLAGQFMRPVSSSHTTELGAAKGVMTGEAVMQAIEHGPASVAAPLAALYLVPKAMNAAIQGTRNGVPYLNNLNPTVGALARGIYSGSAYSGAQALSPATLATLFGGLGQ